jgi:hypothetical protein
MNRRHYESAPKGFFPSPEEEKEEEETGVEVEEVLFSLPSVAIPEKAFERSFGWDFP